MTRFETEIRRIAPVLNGLPKLDDATLEYHGVSDALVWSDELPKRAFAYEQAIRYLLQYRTSVIVGKPIEKIQPYWELARGSFPDWPGFSVERYQRSERLAAYVQEARRKLKAFLDEEESDTSD